MPFSPLRPDRRLLLALAVSLASHGLLLAYRHGGAPAGGSDQPLRATLRQAGGESSGKAQAPAPAPDLPARPEAESPPPAPERSYGPRLLPGMEDPAPAASEAPPVSSMAMELAARRLYYSAVAPMLQRFHVYPPEAREAGWEGRVVLRLAISEEGIPLGLAVIGSSGIPGLDQAALEVARLAVGHTPVPEGVKGIPFTIDLALTYNLQDAQ